jgi:signal transduction histidine kinase
MARGKRHIFRRSQENDSLLHAEEEHRKRENKKEEFFLAASHQLKSPVAIIQWCLQSIMENPPADPEERKYVEKALQQANSMSDLITDMLRVFRLMRSQTEETYIQVNVNQLITEVYEQYCVVAEQRQVRLRLGPIEILPTVYADPHYLKQALINLVDNAIKYTPSGKSVEIRARQVRKKEIEFEVIDEGIGITPADQAQLFKEFFRSVAARDMIHDGTGLGLVLVKQIAEKLDGSIHVKSEFGKGSTFTLRIPFKD